MKILAKAALGALMLAGATALTATPAAARVDIGIGFGFPGYYYGPPAYPYYAYCDRWSRWYDPYRCGYYAPRYARPYYGGYYGGPSIVFGFGGGGGWRGGHGGWHGGHGGWHGGHHR